MERRNDYGIRLVVKFSGNEKMKKGEKFIANNAVYEYLGKDVRGFPLYAVASIFDKRWDKKEISKLPRVEEKIFIR
jgi:hypothetical protein